MFWYDYTGNMVGQGFQTAYNHAMEIIASVLNCNLYRTHQSIGMKAILLFGTEEQKQILPQLATGEKIDVLP